MPIIGVSENIFKMTHGETNNSLLIIHIPNMKRLWNQQKDDADCPNLFSEKGTPSHEWIKDMYD